MDLVPIAAMGEKGREEPDCKKGRKKGEKLQRGKRWFLFNVVAV